MFDRSELAFKILCGAVLALVLYRFGLFIVHINPLYHLNIPALPSLSVVQAAKSNANSVVALVKNAGTNGNVEATEGKGTNLVNQATNLTARSSKVVEQVANIATGATNKMVRGTNLLAQLTNSIGQSTNVVAQSTNSSHTSTNRSEAVHPNDLAREGMPPRLPGMPPGAFPGMPHSRGPGMGNPGPALPPQEQARIDRVIDSEILAPVMRPLPMALLGIAGRDVFLRAPNGQTGLVKEGDEIGGVKLLRIGINRVLVEEQGEQKELTIFAGLGGESLLSTQKNGPK